MEPLAYLHLVQDNETPETRSLTALPTLALLKSVQRVSRSSTAAVGLFTVLSSVWGLALPRVASAKEPITVLLMERYSKGYAGGGYFYILEEFIEDKLALAVPRVSPEYHSPAPLPTLPSTPSSHCDVFAYGDSGPGVECLQDQLRQAGFFHGPSTGYFGSVTKEAVIAFQQNCGLFVDGVAGPQTLAALHDFTAQSPTATPY
jgi:hypothetical protein